ncbi:MAG: hypothetical protein EB127_26650, partial [Alphaproteobacteria bacterium]|nr:hypothetical protein [Alphaproteobacteria bacterium]
LKEGVIYQVSELLPIHSSSSYAKDNAQVVPDNDKWLKVQTSKGNFAFHKDECPYEIKQAIDIDGNKIYVHEDYSHYVTAQNDNGDYIYFTCEEAAKANDFDFSIRLGRYWDKKSDSFYGDTTLFNYHQGVTHQDKIPSFVNDDDEFIVGIEVEKVDRRLQRDSLVYELLQNTGWKKESDGSLGDGGYELVSPKLPLLDMNRILKACEPVKKYINGQSDSSCGGHLNVSRKGVSSRDLLKGMKGFVPIIYALYENRLTNRYCQAKKWNNYFNYRDKYTAFYLKNENICEIRLFSRVTNYTTLQWRIKLLQTLFGDYGKNLNQFVLKMSNRDSSLYKLLNEQYEHDKIGKKITLVDELSRRYGCGKISKSVRIKVNDRFGYTVLPLI